MAKLFRRVTSDALKFQFEIVDMRLVQLRGRNPTAVDKVHREGQHRVSTSAAVYTWSFCKNRGLFLVFAGNERALDDAYLYQVDSRAKGSRICRTHGSGRCIRVGLQTWRKPTDHTFYYVQDKAEIPREGQSADCQTDPEDAP